MMNNPILEIDKIKEGRKIDEIIADKIFELPQIRKVYLKLSYDLVYNVWADKPDKNCLYVSVPEYSTDIAEAWKVIEKVRQIDNCWCPNIYWDDNDGIGDGFWVCNFIYYGKSEEEYKECQSHDKSASLAICRASLKAILSSDIFE